jgi:hypothetical protein
MEFIQVKILNKIDNLVKLSNDFDSGFKIIYNLDPSNQLNESNVELLYLMTKNYILMRKEHGGLLLMMNKFTNSINYNVDADIQSGGKSNKNISKLNTTNTTNTINNDEENTKVLYDLSTFNTLLGNVNDLITNIDYEYKKISIRYPKFINIKQMTIIFISQDSGDKYSKLMEEIKIEYPEHKYKIIKCEDNKESISKCDAELKEYGIKIKPKTLPVIYIINGTTVSEIPISKIDSIEPIKNLIK